MTYALLAIAALLAIDALLVLWLTGPDRREGREARRRAGFITDHPERTRVGGSNKRTRRRR